MSQADDDTSSADRREHDVAKVPSIQEEPRWLRPTDASLLPRWRRMQPTPFAFPRCPPIVEEVAHAAPSTGGHPDSAVSFGRQSEAASRASSVSDGRHGPPAKSDEGPSNETSPGSFNRKLGDASSVIHHSSTVFDVADERSTRRDCVGENCAKIDSKRGITEKENDQCCTKRQRCQCASTPERERDETSYKQNERNQECLYKVKLECVDEQERCEAVERVPDGGSNDPCRGRRDVEAKVKIEGLDWKDQREASMHGHSETRDKSSEIDATQGGELCETQIECDNDRGGRVQPKLELDGQCDTCAHPKMVSSQITAALSVAEIHCKELEAAERIYRNDLDAYKSAAAHAKLLLGRCEKSRANLEATRRRVGVIVIDEDDDEPDRRHGNISCQHCTKMFAPKKCTNGLCGLCCGTHGRRACPRHKTQPKTG